MSQFQPGHSLSSFCLHKDRKKPWSGLQRCIYPQIMQWKGVVQTSCSCFAAERSASRGGAVSQTQHQAQGPSGQTAGESRGPGMEPTPREGKPLVSALSAWLHNLPGSLTYLTPPLLLCQVTEEVLSILRLLSPLTEADSRSAELPPDGEKQLDAALSQLQTVARQLAISNTNQVNVQPVCNKVRCSYHAAHHITGLFSRACVWVCVCLSHSWQRNPTASFLTHFWEEYQTNF